jgi:hypothetical protein
MRAASLTAQHDLIVGTTVRILGGKADLWLDERLFRLPGINQADLYPSQPPSGPMEKAFYTGLTASPEGQINVLAVPLKNGGLVMGALHVERSDLPFLPSFFC